MRCRSCATDTERRFIDLQSTPLSNAFISPEDSGLPEVYFRLCTYVCPKCFLVQIDECRNASEHFNASYVYFSSYSEEFLRHAREYVESITKQLKLGPSSLVVEAASNDGYLLQFFKDKGIPCLGVEPSASVAAVAMEKGIETKVDFFTAALASSLAQTYGQVDLFLGNNVIAHVPDLNDFIAGINLLLKPTGTVTLEFPHLLNLIRDMQFDTIYHEHYSYYSLHSISIALQRHGLHVYKVEEFPVHGGSLRIYAGKKDNVEAMDGSVQAMLEREYASGLNELSTYTDFQWRINQLCCNFIQFLVEQKKAGKTVVGYGAAAKGNTMLNYCGIKPYLMEYVVDITPAKQGKLLPGSRIPVVDEEHLRATRPDYIVILPWNWRATIEKRLSFVREWGAKFVVAIPELTIW